MNFFFVSFRSSISYWKSVSKEIIIRGREIAVERINAGTFSLWDDCVGRQKSLLHLFVSSATRPKICISTYFIYKYIHGFLRLLDGTDRVAAAAASTQCISPGCLVLPSGSVWLMTPERKISLDIFGWEEKGEMTLASRVHRGGSKN